MMTRLKDAIVATLTQVLSSYNSVRHVVSSGNKRKVLIIPPAAPGSLGDEAMIKGLSDRFSKMGIQVFCCGYNEANEWCFIDSVQSGISLRDLLSDRSTIFKFQLFSLGFDRVLLVGADVLDGNYTVSRSVRRLDLLSYLGKIGQRCEVVGCSFNGTTDEEIGAAWRRAAKACHIIRARDPHSAQRLESIVGKPVDRVADAAFLLVGERKSERALKIISWINKKRNDDYTIVGINVNYLHLNRLACEQKAERYFQSIAEVFSTLCDRHRLSFLLIPHDFRGDESDHSILKELKSKLEESNPGSCFLIEPGVTASEIKGICSQLDFVFTGRMHLAIASLGSGIPVACVTYQGKFEGLMSHFSCDDTLISPEEVCTAIKLEAFVSDVFNRRHDLEANIRKALPSVMELAEKNIHSNASS